MKKKREINRYDIMLGVTILLIIFLSLELSFAKGNNEKFCNHHTFSSDCSYNVLNELCTCNGEVYDPRNFTSVQINGTNMSYGMGDVYDIEWEALYNIT